MENRFKDILKMLRQEANVGQVELAKAIGVSNGIISLWESGKREPTMSSLISLSNYFKVSLDYLAGKED